MEKLNCLIIGASHAGVNCAFALRKEGWTGNITLFDSDPNLPYHRPPLSKSFLTSEFGIEKHQLKPQLAYAKDEINLNLGKRITVIDRQNKVVTAVDGVTYTYDKLVLATGASPLIPNIEGLKSHPNIYPLRTAQDVLNIKSSFENSISKKVIIIGGGYIGLEIAASLISLSAHVTLLEREERLLARVTSPEVSQYFEKTHKEKGVIIHTAKEVTKITKTEGNLKVTCSDQTVFESDMIIFGVGIRVNTDLATEANLEVKSGIVVNGNCETSDKDIYAIGDNTYHYNPHYDRHLRLESVQNAVDQGKVAAKAICEKSDVIYDAIPWFWSDQYNLKLQMVGLIEGYNEVIERIDLEDENKRSAWFFKNEELLSVQAVNDAKAYVYGTKLIKEKAQVNKGILKSTNEPLDIKRLAL
ncbi:NAD(P)/FAD-dependent oxidoreductase [Arcticibacterium luteifluviistationis]|uniref:Pyridine nucleotide-disulfide oxidoreductase n=1 Tax=Arcticibacterium luteifluviistationis TaxID=1784714 RepID=A0A2Z4G6I4_9BACT|nr:FAD/NAD(P)-binding oxidoreductase [Arcticibacterium luteifluviistationis]AWV96752.1 pyridine nucleotide-disulfide oxidoreductase [Arcticibacterium luteifluviistationis]